MNPAAVRGLKGLDDLARMVFPDNRRHRLAFVAIWLELKYAEDHFLASFSAVPQKYGVSPRVLETVRARMKRIGLLKRISHFNPHHGHVSGWTFSPAFAGVLTKLASAVEEFKRPSGSQVDEQKDRDSISYV